MNIYETKPYRDRRDAPITSIYLLDDEGSETEKLSCMFCKRTIYDLKGTIDKTVSTPVPVEDFGIAINILCKQCHQRYRMLINPLHKH